MNQESENLGKLLNNEFFLSFEVEELNEEELLSDEVFNEIFSIKNPVKRTQIIAKMRKQAQRLKITKSFNEMLKLYQMGTSGDVIPNEEGIIDFKNSPLKNLKCGNWICSDNGVSKTMMCNNMPVLVVACYHPIIPIERLINIDTNTEKIRLSFYKDHKWKDVIVNKNSISTKNKIIQLADRGIEVNDDNAKNLITFLSDILTLNQESIPISQGITHLGWADGCFVPYTEKYSFDGEMEFKEKFEAVKEKGDYTVWKETVKEIRTKSKYFRFVLASAFAGVLIEPLNINSFFVDYWGTSKFGKSLAQLICASVWGSPERGKCITNIDGTAVSQERICDFFKNIPVIFEELQLIKDDPQKIQKMIYSLTSGKGKDRGQKEGGLQMSTHWSTLFITSGEQPLSPSISKEGIKNRVIECEETVPLTNNGRHVAGIVRKNYGFAGKQFIDIITNQEKNYIARYNEICEELKPLKPNSKQIESVAVVLLADEIISKYIFEDEKLSVQESATLFFPEEVDEAEEFMGFIIDVIKENSNRFIIGNTIPQSGEIWGRLIPNGSDPDGTPNKIEIIPTKLYKLLSDIGQDWNGIKRKLSNKGYVMRSSKGEYTQNAKLPKLGQTRVIKFEIPLFP